MDGLARIHETLLNISEALQRVEGELTRPAPSPIVPDAEVPVLLSIGDLAKAFGLPRSAVDTLAHRSTGPVVTMVGDRKFFHRDDVQHWLERQRQPRNTYEQTLRTSWLPGKIGADVKASSARPKRVYCPGSGTHPTARSKYGGRGVCGECRDDVLVNNDGRLRKHYPSFLH